VAERDRAQAVQDKHAVVEPARKLTRAEVE
jgi:hypothetical protein